MFEDVNSNAMPLDSNQEQLEFPWEQNEQENEAQNVALGVAQEVPPEAPEDVSSNESDSVDRLRKKRQ